MLRARKFGFSYSMLAWLACSTFTIVLPICRPSGTCPFKKGMSSFVSRPCVNVASQKIYLPYPMTAWLACSPYTFALPICRPSRTCRFKKRNVILVSRPCVNVASQRNLFFISNCLRCSLSVAFLSGTGTETYFACTILVPEGRHINSLGLR